MKIPCDWCKYSDAQTRRDMPEVFRKRTDINLINDATTIVLNTLENPRRIMHEYWCAECLLSAIEILPFELLRKMVQGRL